MVNVKRPLRMPEDHSVLFAGHSSKSGVLGNGHSNGCINTFRYYSSTFKKNVHHFQGVVGLVVINVYTSMILNYIN